MISRDNPYELADTASRAITNAMGSSLDVAVVLGSGWSIVGERMGNPRGTMDLVDLPGAVPPTVTGHSGMIRAVELENRVALLIGGRSHGRPIRPDDVEGDSHVAHYIAGEFDVLLPRRVGFRKTD